MSHIYDVLLDTFVICRGQGSGVTMGTLIAWEPASEGRIRILLKDSTRLWRWSDQLELSGVAVSGPGAEARISRKLALRAVPDCTELLQVEDKNIIKQLLTYKND